MSKKNWIARILGAYLIFMGLGVFVNPSFAGAPTLEEVAKAGGIVVAWLGVFIICMSYVFEKMSKGVKA